MPFPAGDAVPLNPLNYDIDDRWRRGADAGDRLLFHRLSERGVAVKVLNRETGAVTTVSPVMNRLGRQVLTPRALVSSMPPLKEQSKYSESGLLKTRQFDHSARSRGSISEMVTERKGYCVHLLE